MQPVDLRAAIARAARQDQFLDVLAPDEAKRRFLAHLDLTPRGEERVALSAARTRVLARDMVAPVDVPCFDRAMVDGFALRAADTEGATPATPRVLRLNPDLLTPGATPAVAVAPGTATVIATGGMMPRGADAVVMVEMTEAEELGEALAVAVHALVVPGQGIATAGSDIAAGETVLRRGRVLTSREIGMLAAIGVAEVPVWRRARVAILSTGNELVPPGTPIRPGQVYDSNAAVLEAAVAELGGEPVRFGIIADDEAALEATLSQALAACDMVLLSGGTSKGAGDVAHQVVARLGDPGIVVHGVALKPGKPLCLAVTGGKPVAVLPGFPTSAMFTFHEFLAPVIRTLGRLPPGREESVKATLPLRISSERGRTEFVMASLIPRPEGGLAAYPSPKGSGAVTAFAMADGFFAVPAQTETLAAGTEVTVRLIGGATGLPDLTVIGSHCVGLDLLVGLLEQEGLTVKTLAVGSTGGLSAARRGECDIAGVHLMDSATGVYNRPFLSKGLELVPGYGRLQGVVFRLDDARLAQATDATAVVAAALADPSCLMVNRNAGSGTRVLIDRLLAGVQPPGYAFQVNSHNGVAVSVVQGRADWGMTIETVARQYGLGFLPLQAEQYDFVISAARDRAPVRRFIALLQDSAVRAMLRARGFTLD